VRRIDQYKLCARIARALGDETPIPIVAGDNLLRVNGSLRNWGVILLLVLLAGSAVLWPAISDRLGGSSSGSVTEAETIEINLPVTVNGTDSIELSTLPALGILLAVVIAVVAGAGIALALGYTMLSRQVDSLAESDSYKSHLSSLAEKNKEQFRRLSEERSVMPVPDHKMPRWSVISTSLIILLFVALFGMIINGTFVPEGEYVVASGLVNSALPVAGGLVVIALLLLVWRMRPKLLEGVEATDYEAIPWDSLWVVLSGVLVVGLGIALLVYLNVPA
jgi:hypothetical protein